MRQDLHMTIDLPTALSYAMLFTVAFVPMTPTFLLFVCLAAAEDAGSMTPNTGIGSFFLRMLSESADEVLHAITSAFIPFARRKSAVSSA